MIGGYSLNLTVPANSPCAINNLYLDKGDTAELISGTTIQFNIKGVYMVECSASATAASTLQLYKNGVAQPQAQAVGTNPHFETFVQVPNNNTDCCCTSPVLVQIMNPTDTAETFSNLSVNVYKMC